MEFKERFHFLKSFLKDKNVASVTPSSQFSVKRICRKIDFSQPGVIVEYGPGTGVISRFLLQRMHPKGRLIVVETNQEFIKVLNGIPDHRLTVVHDNAENIQGILHKCGIDKANYIISGIPFSYIPKEKRKSLLRKTHEALAPSGKFLTYQFLFSLKKPLEAQFEELRQEIELRNLPPLFIFEAIKRKRGLATSRR